MEKEDLFLFLFFSRLFLLLGAYGKEPGKLVLLVGSQARCAKEICVIKATFDDAHEFWHVGKFAVL